MRPPYRRTNGIDSSQALRSGAKLTLKKTKAIHRDEWPLLLCREVAGMLIDADIAGAGFKANGRSAAIDRTGDMVVVGITMHGDLVGGVDGAGVGGCVEIETGVTSRELDVARAGGKTPVG